MLRCLVSVSTGTGSVLSSFSAFPLPCLLYPFPPPRCCRFWTRVPSLVSDHRSRGGRLFWWSFSFWTQGEVWGWKQECLSRLLGSGHLLQLQMRLQVPKDGLVSLGEGWFSSPHGVVARRPPVAVNRGYGLCAVMVFKPGFPSKGDIGEWCGIRQCSSGMLSSFLFSFGVLCVIDKEECKLGKITEY
ncbi:unnamed protein product [Eruca vesicaria subsp. sativa]|uniref:Uncharacterized protein n=1 Tax=Eruca vesicaria subsp. sativa TaxID=29727 RepID=A0ABC8JZC5_ERUVS|nr:unnamed protein product [Eruca vesicaria subsp. sativa]